MIPEVRGHKSGESPDGHSSWPKISCSSTAQKNPMERDNYPSRIELKVMRGFCGYISQGSVEEVNEMEKELWISAQGPLGVFIQVLSTCAYIQTTLG